MIKLNIRVALLCVLPATILLSSAANAQTITPPLPELIDGHWWEIQNNASPYETQCEGPALDGAIVGCVATPGVYTVINHTTGERFEGITVSDTPPTADPIRFETIGTVCDLVPFSDCFASCPADMFAVTHKCDAEDFDTGEPIDYEQVDGTGSVSCEAVRGGAMFATVLCTNAPHTTSFFYPNGDPL